MQTETRSTLLEESRFDSTLRQLIAYHSGEGVLSVYLDVDPAEATREGYEAALIDLWKPLHARQYDDWTRGRLEYEVAAVTDAVRGWRQPPARSVAMFFSGPGGLRTVLPLQFPIRSVARFEARPVVSPLIAAMEEHRRYCVVVFDKERARIITVFLGAVEEEIVLHDDVMGRTAAGGWGQANYARHRDHQVDEHARRTVEHLWAADRSRPIHALILGGPDEALAVLRRTLPPSLSRAVVETMPVEMFADTSDVVALVAEAEAAAREREDVGFVEELVADAGKGARAAAGWSETLQALSDGRVHRLVLAAGATRPGVMCPEGHFLATSALKFCPLCSETLWQTDDIAEAAVRAAMLTDAQVRFLSPRASEQLGERGIAAQLRY